MLKNKIFRKLENGQVIPLVVLMMFVIIGMVALILDGGALMSNRRSAQAAADAGALAGAQRLCEGKDNADAAFYAQKYVENNDAVPVSISVSGEEVNVVAAVKHPSFFAGIFGEDNLETSAEATAICENPSIWIHPLPVAFFYMTAPESGKSTECGEDLDQPCALITWDFMDLLDELKATPPAGLPLDYIYFISDNVKICSKKTGTIVCVDMIKDTGGGSRTWIDLSPLKKPPANIAKIIQDGLDAPLVVNPRLWVNSYAGTVTSGYQYISDMPQISVPGYDTSKIRLTYVPLYDKFCPTGNSCAEPGDQFIHDYNGNYAFKNTYNAYRLSGYSAYVVTCVMSSGDCVFGCNSKKDMCPGYGLPQIQAILPSDKNLKNTVEGYFVTNIPDDLSGIGGADGGIYTVSLLK